MEKNRTKDNFIAAFWRLYADKPLERISIQALCEAAGYNRATFYNHFDNIYDLFDRAVEGIYGAVRDHLFATVEVQTLLQGELIKNVMASILTQKNDRLELIFKRGNGHLLAEKLKREMLHFYQSRLTGSGHDLDKIALLVDYQSAAVLGVISRWYEAGKPISEQKLLSTIYNISSKGVLAVLREELGGSEDREDQHAAESV